MPGSQQSQIANRKSQIELPPHYEPQEVEANWYARWEARGYFTAAAGPTRPLANTQPEVGDTYCITIPPPNVTGSLHMGHALNHSVQDLLIRWNRMRGRRTLCVPGTDHASIAVHAKIEAELRGEGKSRHDLGREQFLERAWAWKAHYGNTIIKQLRMLGCSYDWQRERFTMDDHYTRAVQRVFVEWYRKGWIYRGYRIINWCTQCRTSLSDLEAPMVEQPGKLYYLRYPVVDLSSPFGRGEGGEGESQEARAAGSPPPQTSLPQGEGGGASNPTASSSPPPGPRPCWAIRRWPSTRRTSVTRIWSAARCCCR